MKYFRLEQTLKEGMKYSTLKKMKWVKNKVIPRRMVRPKITMEARYSDIMTKVLRQLENRRFASVGKIVASKLVYILSPLPTNYRVLIESSYI